MCVCVCWGRVGGGMEAGWPDALSNHLGGERSLCMQAERM